ncbi:uncharacterized protein K460DRAFT_360433 [Cucurbitaria berberidis CBS 394.84]|uniref:MutL C-terminal dimerisation domain-containing protein n=1 Tax=Cucurbitaria berberidis CBS 394.84 TaxID=1168544 RepID=A0A9P4GPT1_9PLEO|nr:uncharacterized protein K460DRAFT_360433 [Cucurbitaria berberidis CBS 394.84]KAF1849572.1 hypothetical protein K460DRAFT_360433 [Cucurbitaria berberidis CBS 394.84]
MTQEDDVCEEATSANARGRSILPLPDAVIAQVKSSTAIVSLTGVILGLLSNSLDAKASSIDATVDFARGGCTIEDNGLGISPVEFTDEGGLGKLHCTSKYYSHDTLLGRNGAFLAALAAMSLMTITSRHHEYRSHNSITFLHSKATERRLPASTNQQVHSKHGTRVTVRNLFGNLPVRVKQRSMVTEQKAEVDRLWHSLKRHVTGLLLGWGGVISLKIRDGDNRVLLNFNTSSSSVATRTYNKGIDKPRSAQLSSMLNLLTQANYITIDEWASWVPAAASTSALSIKGAISLDPAPSKNVQYISLGIRSLSAESGQNELYDVVNRLFALSSFGTVEDGVDVDDLETVRRQADKRFKNGEYTNWQLKSRKDVDRYPMFHLRISLNSDHAARLSEDRLTRDETNLQAAIEVLSAMVTQWLSVHHFQPKLSRKSRNQPSHASPAPSESVQGGSLLLPEDQVAPTARTGARSSTRSATAIPKSTTSATCKWKRPTSVTSREPSEKRQNGAFAEWSRIKSANSSFFSNLPTLSKSTIGRGAATQLDCEDVDRSPAFPTRPEGFSNFEVEPVPRGAFNACSLGEEPSEAAIGPCADDDEPDDAILWADPSTKQTYTLNARTGCVMPDARARPKTHSATSTLGITQKLNTSIRLTSRPATALAKKTPWLDSVLQTWDNPIFIPSEQRIQQVSLERNGFEGASHQCSHLDMDKAATTTGASRLSKQGLQEAEVIAQVDDKFILIKMQGASTSSPGQKPNGGELLVLVDQHAADERVQVESLLRELCTPLTETSVRSSYQSKLGHRAQVASVTLARSIQFTISPQERMHFETHAARFAAWGILYDVVKSPSSSTTTRPGTSDKTQSLLSVTTLPPGISERCKSDPQVLFSFLRSSVWTYADDPHLSLSSTENADASDWVRRLATCPQGLIGLINSRACRSAIMFNDKLGLDQCELLLKELSRCVFPFMCAHGRPSMVPLLDLGSIGHVVHGLGGEGGAERDRKSFVEAWKTWRRKD